MKNIALLTSALSFLTFGCDNTELDYPPVTAADNRPAYLAECVLQPGFTRLVVACPDHPGCVACAQENADVSTYGTESACWLSSQQSECAAHCDECPVRTPPAPKNAECNLPTLDAPDGYMLELTTCLNAACSTCRAWSYSGADHMLDGCSLPGHPALCVASCGEC